MITDRELDDQLAGAAGVSDADLPALPEDFLAALTAGAAAPETATVLAARQLVADAYDARSARRRRPSRKAVTRIGAVFVAVAAAWTTAVLVVPHDADRAPGATATPTPERPTDTVVTPPAGLAPVAASDLTFPLSLDPEPEGLTPAFTRTGGQTPFGPQPVVFEADYRSTDGDGFTFWLSPTDPRQQEGWGRGEYDDYDAVETGTTTVAGTEADFVSGDYGRPQCTTGRGTPEQSKPPAEVCTSTFTDLFWHRPDGQWVWIRGEDSYGDVAAVVRVAESLVDRPQPAGMRIDLAPVGWVLSGYEEGRSITFSSSADPMQYLSAFVLERWRGRTVDRHAFDGMNLLGPVESVTINGQEAWMVRRDGQPYDYEWWDVVGHLDDGTPFGLYAPDTLSKEQVLAIAGEVTYAP